MEKINSIKNIYIRKKAQIIIIIIIIIIGLVFCQGLSFIQPSTLCFLVCLFFVCLSHPVAFFEVQDYYCT